jgi:transcriptional regulator with XRE-family HTH domain
MDYGIKIYELRKEKGLSQEEVANKLGVSRQSISLWETNQASPSVENLISFAKLFNTSIDELVGVKDVRTIAENSNETSLFSFNYKEDKHVVFRRDYKYLNSKADIIMFFISLTFLIFALLSFISALNMETQVARIALIIGFISNMIGLVIYPLYIYINILKKTENQQSIHIEFHNDYLVYDDLYHNKKTIPNELIDYYIRKKDYLLIYTIKGPRIYVPTKNNLEVDEFLSEKVERRKNKKLFWK